MANLYKVIEIQGKGFGCVATQDIPKGTLILAEKPQIVLDQESIFGNLRKNVCSGFFAMSKEDQQEYFKLSNSFKEENDLNVPMKQKLEVFKKFGLSGRMLEIMEIYATNSFSEGLGIKMSRFNHSCGANTCYYLNKEKGLPEIRSLEEIKAGCEITVNYMTRSLAMKNRETRQNKLSSERGFECCCELCKKESTVSDDEKYERFEKLNHKFDQLQASMMLMHELSQFQIFQKCKEGISNLKEMYKLALEKKPSRSSIDKILEEGIYLGTVGYELYQCSWDSQKGKFFKNECKFFEKELKGSVLYPFL